MNRMRGFSRRPLLAVDAQGYGASTPLRQHWIQTAIDHALTEAATEVGFDRGAWKTQVAGDSALSVLPAEESEPLLVDDFMRHLDSALSEVNDGREPDARLRLRAAVHHGPAVPAAGGFSDSGPVEISRILDCAPLKKALRLSPRAQLAMAVSREVFHTVIGRKYTTLKAEEFREFRVRDKEFDDTVWIRVLGGDVHGLGGLGGLDGDGPGPQDLGAPPSSPPGPAGTPGQQSVQYVTGPVHGSVIGIVNNPGA
ncbi:MULTISPECIES: hypothetical protein [unclassified Streptomyces]|uniref:hypothetical protein n=1 Tax=unclassified Streptomyces TaxID=2593676 RepID=UPI00404256C2